MSRLFVQLVMRQRRSGPVTAYVLQQTLGLFGIDIPPQVEIGDGLRLPHRGYGSVIHRNTLIGRNVTIYHGVTIGRADSWVPMGNRHFEPVVIEDGAVLCAKATILAREPGLRVGVGTVIGANSVLTRSTGDWEIWAGCPAVKVSDRADAVHVQTVQYQPRPVSRR